MNLKRGLNRKGQEGLTLTTLLLIVLGVIVVVMVVLFVTGFFDKLSSGTENVLPGSLQAAIEGCQLAGDNGLTADFCLAYREVEIDGKDVYTTCMQSEIYNSLDKNTLQVSSCAGNHPDATAYCENMKLSSGTNIVVYEGESSRETTCKLLIDAKPSDSTQVDA